MKIILPITTLIMLAGCEKAPKVEPVAPNAIVANEISAPVAKPAPKKPVKK